MEKSQIKELILNQLHKLLDKKIEALEQYIESAKESRDNETKSSVGDKYETGRAMAQMELDKNQTQLTQIQNQKNELLKIDVSKKYDQSEFGAIIITNIGNYFLSIGIGKVELENESCFCISASSPIGQQFLNKLAGDSVFFNGKEILIKEVF